MQWEIRLQELKNEHLRMELEMKELERDAAYRAVWQLYGQHCNAQS